VTLGVRLNLMPSVVPACAAFRAIATDGCEGCRRAGVEPRPAIGERLGVGLDESMISRYRQDMRRRKVSTILDEHLFRRAKLESVRQRRQVSAILGEALERYLTDTGSRASSGVVAETWGVLKLNRRMLDRMLQDEEGLLDA